VRLRIQTCRDYLLFPGVIIGCWVTGFYLKSVLLFLVASYFILVLLMKKQVAVLVLCCIGSMIIGVRMILFHHTELPEEAIEAEVLVYPDTIKVNGDLVTFEGKLPEGSIMGRYQVSSNEEKEQWLLRQNWQKYLQVSAEFKKEEPSRNKHGFDYAFYLDSRNFLGTLTIHQIIASKPANGLAQIHGWRASAITHVKEFFPQRLASYINALLFGYKDHEFQEIRQMYSSSGLLHFFTVSGMHVSFFFLWVEKGLRRMKLTRGEMFGPTLFLLLVASIFFGRSISVIRAILAYGLSVLLRLFSWRISAGDQYGLVLFLTLLVDPKVFLQTSGQLCFLMTFLILMQKKVATNFYLSSQYLTLLAAPLIMHLFFEFPIFGGLLTFVFLPFFKKFLLPASGFLFITSLFVPRIDGIATGIELFLQKLEGGLTIISHFSLKSGRIPLWLVAVCLVLGLFLYEQRKFVLCLLVSLFLPIVVQRVTVPTAVTFVDVGQGDSIVLQRAFNQEVYVIDTGGSLSFPREAWQ
jgi:competence protein ComEC